MEFEEIKPNFWKGENEGDSVEGVYINKEENRGMNENSTIYFLEKEGEHIGLWGSTILDSRMKFAKYGDYVRITYKGKEKNSRKQDVNIYKVERGVAQ